jgi:hypothetical protein
MYRIATRYKTSLYRTLDVYLLITGLLSLFFVIRLGTLIVLERLVMVAGGALDEARLRVEEVSLTSGTRTRVIPTEVKRKVWQRDGGSCAYTDAKGRRYD